MRRYEELQHYITNNSVRGTQETLLIPNLQGGALESMPNTVRYSGDETKLDNLHHFITLFDHLQREVAKPSYKIGSRSRSRIEEHIWDARSSEARYLDIVHGVDVMRDTWHVVNQPTASSTNPALASHGFQPHGSSHVNVSTLSSQEHMSAEACVERPPGDNVPKYQESGRSSPFYVSQASAQGSRSWFVNNDSGDESPAREFPQYSGHPLKHGIKSKAKSGRSKPSTWRTSWNGEHSTSVKAETEALPTSPPLSSVGRKDSQSTEISRKLLKHNTAPSEGSPMDTLPAIQHLTDSPMPRSRGNKQNLPALQALMTNENNAESIISEAPASQKSPNSVIYGNEAASQPGKERMGEGIGRKKPRRKTHTGCLSKSYYSWDYLANNL